MCGAFALVDREALPLRKVVAMALSHTGSHPHASPQLRVLLSLCELEQEGTPVTYRLIQHRLGMSTGSLVHHVKQLRIGGLLVESGTEGTLELTQAAFAKLISEGWLTQTRPVVAFELSTAAVEVLEIAAPPDESAP